MEVDPGAHVFRFEVVGTPWIAKKVVVREAEKLRNVAVAFGYAPTSEPADGEGAQTGARSDAASTPSRWPAYVAVAGAGVGLVVGVTFTVLTLHQQTTLDSAAARDTFCHSSQSTCTSMGTTDARTSDTNASSTYNVDKGLAFAGFGLAALGAGIGAYLLLRSSGGATSTGHRATQGVSIAPWVGVRGAGIVGRF